MSDSKAENKALWELLVSRNKLVERLLTELPLSETAFNWALEMRDANWAKDKAIWGKVIRGSREKEDK